MKDSLTDQEIVRVLHYIALQNGLPFADRVLTVKTIIRDEKYIKFGVSGVIGVLCVSWEAFFRRKALLDKTENKKHEIPTIPF